MEMICVGIRFDSIPATASVEFHPVVFTILDLAGVFERLCKKVTKKIVIRSVFETEVADVAEILVELLCNRISEAVQNVTSCYLPGNESHRSLMAVVCFFSPIFSYFCLFVAAFNPCQGNPPRRKYMKTCPNASRSSRLDCSRPRWVLILIYLAVPDNDFRSRYGMCCLVLGSRYCFAIPKSTTCITFADLEFGLPMRKLSGLMSR